jgi:sugar lactone lactonase YvrE
MAIAQGAFKEPSLLSRSEIPLRVQLFCHAAENFPKEWETSNLMKTKILRNIIPGLVTVLAAALLPLKTDAQNLYVSINGDFSNKGGSIFEFTPGGTQITFASEVASPRGITFDGSGNLFLGETLRNNGGAFHTMLLKFPSLGHQTVLGNVALAFAEGVTADGGGNVYVLAQEQRYENVNTIYRFAPDGTRTVFGSIPTFQAFDIKFDNSGNLFAADTFNATIYKFTSAGTRTVFLGPEAFSEGVPVGLAFDSAGNLFVSTEGNPGNDAILEFAPDGTKTVFATGLSVPRGLAFDAAGDLFVAETRAAPDGDIIEVPAGGGMLVFASGLDRPEFLSFGPPR